MEARRRASQTSAPSRTAASGAGPEARARRAEEARRLQERFSWLNRFTDEEIQHLSFCEAGAQFVAGETYFDISHPERGPFVASADDLIPTGGCLVRQRDVPPRLWEKLIRFP